MIVTFLNPSDLEKKQNQLSQKKLYIIIKNIPHTSGIGMLWSCHYYFQTFWV